MVILIYQITMRRYTLLVSSKHNEMTTICMFYQYLTTEWEEITNDNIINQLSTLTVKYPVNYFCSPLTHAIWH